MRRRQKSTAQKLFVILAVPIISLCATFIVLYLLNPRIPTQSTKTSEVTETVHNSSRPAAAFSVPTQLRVESINVAAAVKPVGLTPEGDMDIDENPSEVAWYKLGPKPGEEGSAVIAGHYGWKNGEGSVFNDLHTLVKGDEISTVDEDGRTITFVVSHSKVYEPNQDATDVFRSNDGKAHLNLITCQGEWNSKLSTYSERLVVFADFVK